MQKNLTNAALTCLVFLGGFTGTLSVGYYFFWGETRHGGEYPMALAYYRKYLQTRDPHFKESAAIHRDNANTMAQWGFLSAQQMALGMIGLKINSK